MHAVVITFTQGLPEREYGELCDTFVAAFGTIEGLIAKTFLRNGTEAGGFYIFVDQAAADAYLAGPIIAAVAAEPRLADASIRRYDIDATRSRRTGIATLVDART